MNEMITVSDEICTDIMQYDVLGGQFISDDTPIFGRFKSGIDVNFLWLTSDDKELLIEYSSKLFNTFQDINKLKDVMYYLAKSISDYRFENHYYREQRDEAKQYAHSHKKVTKKYEILQGHIEAILKMIGNEALPKEEKYKGLRTDKDDLIEELNKAYISPYAYLPFVPFYRPDKDKPYNKNTIRNYLVELKLQNKSKIIIEFIEKIKNA